MINSRYIIALLFFGFSLVSHAQVISPDIMSLGLVSIDGSYANKVDTIIPVDTTDSLSVRISEDSLDIVDSLETIDSIVAYVHPLCLPLMYVPEPFLSLKDTIVEETYTISQIRRNALRYITTHHADLYVSISDPNRMKMLEVGKVKMRKTIDEDAYDDQEPNIKKNVHGKPCYWKKKAYLSLQITQNYATDNWYQGSVNAFTMLGNVKASANYKKENISWENTLEWRIGVSTIAGDSIHKLNTTDDRLQIYSKFGYQVHKQWYVSMFADFKTNLLPNFQKNSNKLNASFLTPLHYSMGVGVDCKIWKGLTINFSPVTYKMVYAYVDDPNIINIADFGLDSQSISNEVGSSLRMLWKWKPLKEIELETKFYFFTNYKQIETELEVNVDFIINRFMSAKLMLHPRYDGTIDAVNKEKSKLQFKEVISVGFAHTFR